MNPVPAVEQSIFIRAVALDDIRIRSGGTGRTVEAYAAVFNDPAEVADQDGHYREQNAPGAFTQTIRHRSGRFPVVYHHGMTIAGTPSERGSVPIGVSTEVRVDAKGVLTVSEYARSELADEVLEAIRNGSITGQSYGGRFIKSSPRKPFGGYAAARSGELPLVTRHEVAMHEFGPTPFPAFATASIVGVRADLALGALLRQYDQHGGRSTPSEADARQDDTSQPEGVEQTEEARQHSARSIPLATRIRLAKIARGWE